MRENEKQRYIYVRSINRKIAVSEEEFISFYNETSVFRRRQQRHGECCCPRGKWMFCDTDCEICPYRLTGENASLNETVCDNEGNETEWLNKLEDTAKSPDEIVAGSLEMQRLMAKINEVMPEAIEIIRLRMDGLTDTKIAEEIGIPRTTFLSRMKKLKDLISEDFDIF